MSSVKIFRLHYRDLLGSQAAAPTDTATVLTFGSFDGLHVGHQSILTRAAALADEYKAKATLLSFYPHPSVALGRVANLPYVTNLSQRLAVLKEFGISALGLIFFSKPVRQMPWQDFLDGLLSALPKLKAVVIGDDARIGKGALGPAPLIKEFL